MDDKEISSKMENEEWMHPWDIQSIIDMINTVSVNAWYGRISECSFRCGDQQIDLNGHCYESGWENFTTTTEIRENGKLLFDMDSACVGSYHLEPYVEGRFTDIKDVKKYLVEKYQDSTFEFVTERAPKAKEYFEPVYLHYIPPKKKKDIPANKKKEIYIKEDGPYAEMREGKILLNRFSYDECKDFRRQSQHEKENLYFLTNDGFFMKALDATNDNPWIDELEITRYYPNSKKKEVRRIVFQKDSDDWELTLPTLAQCLEHPDDYLTLENPVDYLVDGDGYVCIQHVSNSGVMEELRIVCENYDTLYEYPILTRHLLREAESLRYSLNQEVNNIPERFLVIFADAKDWNSKNLIHKVPDENERLEGIYDTYDEAYKVLEEASRSGTPNLTVEIRREIHLDNEDRWCGLTEPPLDVMTTDIHGNVSNNETLHFPECEELDALRDIRDICPPEDYLEIQIESLETQKEKPLIKLIRRVRGR